MALTDLTDTTWTLNSTLTSYAGGTYSIKTYNVNITTETPLSTYDGDADTFVMFAVGYDSGGETNNACLYTTSPASWNNQAILASGNDTKALPDTWNSYYAGTFTVTGGTDATNATLIAWMEDNCTQDVPPTPPTPPTPDVVVTYEDSNIVELFEAGIKTLKTAGKYLTDDVVLAYSGGSGGGGGGVETASVTLTAVANKIPSHIYYTDSNMTLQHVTTGEVRNTLMPVGSIIFCYGNAGPATSENAGIHTLYETTVVTTPYAAYDVTG